MARKIRLGILFGGQSGEHEVSLASARSAVEAIDPEKYETVLVGITKEGAWLMGQGTRFLLGEQVEADGHETVELVANVGRHALVPAASGERASDGVGIDVVLPLLHGPLGEDGTVQGFLELAGIPYVGSGVTASAVGMDKAMMKAVFEHAGLPVGAYQVFTVSEWRSSGAELASAIEEGLGFPVFVKPCHMGSSVGISKASTKDELWAAVSEAGRHDRKIIVEKAIRGREIECGILGNDQPLISVFGEVLSEHDFYDYEAKYTDGLARLVIPAKLTADQVAKLTDVALRAFKAIDAEGMARVDFFVEHDSGNPVLNEINTIPGFTRTSMFPKLWEATGIGYSELIDRLVQLALERSPQRPTGT